VQKNLAAGDVLLQQPLSAVGRSAMKGIRFGCTGIAAQSEEIKSESDWKQDVVERKQIWHVHTLGNLQPDGQR
jgi:hypothetical protein